MFIWSQSLAVNLGFEVFLSLSWGKYRLRRPTPIICQGKTSGPSDDLGENVKVPF